MNGCSLLRSGFFGSSARAIAFWLLPLGLITTRQSSENESSNDNAPPVVEATVGDDEINEDAALVPGESTLSFRFEKEGNGDHPIHLIRRQVETDLEGVERWLYLCRADDREALTAVFLNGNGEHRDAPNGEVSNATGMDLEPGPSAWG